MVVDYVKKLQVGAVKQAVDDLVECKRKGGTLGRNEYLSAIDALSKLGVKINRDALYKRVEREFKRLEMAEVQAERMVPIDVTVQDAITEMSSITSCEFLNPANDNNRASTSAVNASLTFSSATSSSAKKNCGSRPKGSNCEKKQKDKENYSACLLSICDDYATEMVAKRALNKNVESKVLDNLIKEKKVKFGVTRDISKGTIRTRIRRERHNPKHPGVSSPLEEAEEALVVICIQMGTIRQPLSVREGVELMNSLIDGTHIQKEVVEFQMARKLGHDLFTYGEIGKGWW